VQLALLPFHRLVFRDYELRDAVALLHAIAALSCVQKDHADLAAIARIDRRRAVRNRDRVFQRQAAARAHLGFVSGRQLDRKPRGHGVRNPGFERSRFDGAKVHSRVLHRPVRILWNLGFCRKFFEADFHCEHAIITFSCRSVSSPCRPCRRRKALTRWHTTAGRPIPYGSRSTGSAATIPRSFSRASTSSTATLPLPISATL